MATITTDTYLDGGTARTAGEAWVMNGGVLTIRTDTRVHANAPAGMLGSLGALTISATLGGGVFVEGRNVREVAYNSGGGVVPAIGTSITQGGVSGYLLGVYANLASAPTAVGAAVPSTGIIKFREVTGGVFAAGALTGITATATGADVASWIEVVHDRAVNFTIPRLGYYRARGTWYELGTTTGSVHQQVQIPTNGGGTETRVPAVWIETGVGTGVYEKFVAVSSTYFTTTNLGTDARSKYVLMDTGGIVRIGGDGTNTIGYLPPAGCKIRIPNILGRQTSAANRALNLVPSGSLTSRPEFATSTAGEIDLEYMMNDWYHVFSSPFKVRILHSATMDIHTCANMASPVELEDYCVGVYLGTSISLTITNSPLGGTITDCNFMRGEARSNGHPWSMSGCTGFTLAGTNETGVISYARSTGNIVFSQSRNITQTGVLITYACTVNPSTCANFDFTLVRYVDRIVGTTNATTGKYAFTTTVSSDNIIVRGVDFGGYTNVHPYLGVFNSSNCTNLTFRNVGSYASPLGSATNAPASIFVDSGNNDTVRVQNVFLTATRTNLYSTSNTSKNLTFERISGTAGSNLQLAAVNSANKGMRRTTANSLAGSASVYGTHWIDEFSSNTAGTLFLAFNEPTAFTAPYYEAVSLGTGAGFTSGGQIAMPNLGDQIIFEMPYFAVGHTALANLAPSLSGTNTANFSYEYQIDVNDGTGWNGTWLTLNAANLSAETIDPVDGFKMKWRMTCTTAATTNALTFVRITTVSTSVAQSAAVYPLDYATIELTGLVANSRVQLYDTTNSVELYNAVVAGTSLTFSTEYTSDFDVRIRVMYQNGATAKSFVEFTDSVTIDGLSRNVTQTDDAVYVANAIDGSTITSISIVDGTFLVEVDTGSISLQQIYAYETYWLYTEEGIRDESRFIVAIDQANYTFEDFNIKNIQSGSLPLVITGGYMKDSVTEEAIDVIDTTGGTIFLAPEHVVPFTTSGGGGAGGDTKEDIYTYFTSSGRQNTFRADVSALATEANATANKDELITEIGSISGGGGSGLTVGQFLALK
jgi:hypothetical protein